MRHLRVINRVTASKNVGFRSLKELLNAADSIRAELPSIDKEIDSYEVAAAGKSGSHSILGGKPSKNDKKLKVFSTADKKSLTENFKLLVDLDEKTKSVDSMIAQMDYQFKGDPGYAAAIKQLKALRTDVAKRTKAVYDIINKVASQNIPTAFKSFCKEVTDGILEWLDGNFVKSKQRLLISLEGDNVIYTSYLILTGLTDDSGFTYDEYSMVFTYATGPDYNPAEYYVNTMPKFTTPGRFARGTELAPKSAVEDAYDVIDMLMQSEGFKHILQGNDLPLDKDDINTDKFNGIADKVAIKSDKLVFTLKRELRGDKKAIQDLFLLVKGLIDGKVTDQQIRYKVSPNGSNVEFYLVSDNQRPLNVDRAKLKNMQKELNLTDRQVKQIMQLVL